MLSSFITVTKYILGTKYITGTIYNGSTSLTYWVRVGGEEKEQTIARRKLVNEGDREETVTIPNVFDKFVVHVKYVQSNMTDERQISLISLFMLCCTGFGFCTM